MRIEKGKSAIIVRLRPAPGHDKQQEEQVVEPDGITSPLAMKIGESGELIFTKRAYQKLGKVNLDYDQIVKVFAPHGWLFYEYVALQCDTCKKVHGSCGAVYGGSDGCYRYEYLAEEQS